MTESGTGLVHTTLVHGQEDFLNGMKYKLLVLSLLEDNGNFTNETRQFSGLDVLGDGNVAIVKSLDEHSCLIMEEVYKHKYPHDWRKKKPSIFRATKQWFSLVEGFRQAILDAIKNVKWVPPHAKNHITL